MGRKTTVWVFQATNKDISREKTWTWLRKGNIKIETENLLIAAQNYAIRTNYINARTEKTQQNSEFKLCGDREETVNRKISERNKWVQGKYKNRQEWVGMVIYWELCKEFEFDSKNKRYMHMPESVLENEMNKILRDYEMQTDLLITVRWPDLVIVIKRKQKLPNRWLSSPVRPQSKIKRNRKERWVPRSCQRTDNPPKNNGT